MKRGIVLLGCLCLLSAPVKAGGTDVKTYTRAIKAAVVQNYDEARKIAKKTADVKLIKLIDWFWLTDQNTVPDFNAAKDFIKRNPDWPRIYQIRRNAELALLNEGQKSALEKWFKQHSPVSTQAVLTYADILFEKKEWEKAVPMLHQLWIKGDLTAEESDEVREKLFFLLDERDFSDRAKRLLDDRKPALAKPLFPLIAKDVLPLAVVRADLITNAKNASKEIRSLPENQRADAGLMFDLLRWMRVNKKYDAAAKLLDKIPPEKQKTPRWWTEKSALLRQFLMDRDYQAAYAVAQKHYMTQGADFADAEWTAGWIALQHLKKPDKAITHFQRMLDAVSSPLSIARGEYWLARAYEGKKKSQKAVAHYKKAAENPTTIYGQLAVQKIKDLPVYPLPAENAPEKSLQDKVKKSELFAVMQMLEKAEMHDLAGLFATRLFLNASTQEETTALAHVLTNDLKRRDLAVSIARRARQNGIHIVELGYPVLELKHDERTETALVLSIIRQESSFASHAVSPAGARGLMQIMPATAREMARKKRKSFNVDRLNSNPDFNVELGSSYFAELLKRFDGSYILAIAAYNAGPTNVKRWMKSLGKPHEELDDVDWIEHIPFAETRNYVQRVLENLNIYRRYLNYEPDELNRWTQDKRKD